MKWSLLSYQTDYLLKPIEPNALQKALHKYQDRQQIDLNQFNQLLKNFNPYSKNTNQGS